MTLKRLFKQKKEFQHTQFQGISLTFSQSDPFLIHAILDGPEGTPYVGGKFHVTINIPKEYPFKPPKAKFSTPIYHPGVNAQGMFCCCFTLEDQHVWAPVLTIEHFIKKYRDGLFIESIDFSECSNFGDAFYEFRQNRQQFYRTAQVWTKKFASKSNLSLNRINLKCGVCTKIIQNKDNFCYLSCGHHFHPMCFWKCPKKNMCPSCQQSLLEMEEMQFFMNNIGQESNFPLFGSNSPKVKRLLLANNSLTEEFIKKIYKTPLQFVETLDFSSQVGFPYENSIKDQGCKYFVEMRIPNLSRLFLRYNGISQKGISYFCHSSWPKLTCLFLQGNNIQSRGIQYLRICDWKILSVLNLSGTHIGKKGVQNLVKSKWPLLNNLNISQCDVTDFGLASLVDGDWKNLCQLELSSNSITDMGFMVMACSCLPALNELHINRNNIRTGHIWESIWPKMKRVGNRKK